MPDELYPFLFYKCPKWVLRVSSNLYAKFYVVFAMKNGTVEKKATENTAKNKMKKFDIAALQKAYKGRPGG